MTSQPNAQPRNRRSAILKPSRIDLDPANGDISNTSSPQTGVKSSELSITELVDAIAARGYKEEWQWIALFQGWKNDNRE